MGPDFRRDVMVVIDKQLSRDPAVKIDPQWIRFLDQCDFPRASPLLELTFAIECAICSNNSKYTSLSQPYFAVKPGTNLFLCSQTRRSKLLVIPT